MVVFYRFNNNAAKRLPRGSRRRGGAEVGAGADLARITS